jgi:hypothetical protein
METTIYHNRGRKSDSALLVFLLLIAITIVAMVSGCSSVRVTSEQDNNAQFSAYRSFAWLPPDQKDLQQNVTARNQAAIIQNAVDMQLEQRGMKPDTTAPDILLRYHIGQKNNVSYHNEPVYQYAPMQPFLWGRRLWYGGGGYYPVYLVPNGFCYVFQRF